VEPIAQRLSPELLYAWIRILVSLSVLAASLYIILSQVFPSDTIKWAYGMVGVVTGYWLR
jgi:predicted membrane protein